MMKAMSLLLVALGFALLAGCSASETGSGEPAPTHGVRGAPLGDSRRWASFTMGTARIGHTATALPNGQVLVTRG